MGTTALIEACWRQIRYDVNNSGAHNSNPQPINLWASVLPTAPQRTSRICTNICLKTTYTVLFDLQLSGSQPLSHWNYVFAIQLISYTYTWYDVYHKPELLTVTVWLVVNLLTKLVNNSRNTCRWIFSTLNKNNKVIISCKGFVLLRVLFTVSVHT